MLPPVLEIYVVWHPNDIQGRQISEEFINHFHGTVFSGLIGGAIEVYVRSEGWRSNDDAPRPIPFNNRVLPHDIKNAGFIAIVPLLGIELAAAVQREGAWQEFVRGIAAAQHAQPNTVAIFPYLLSREATNQTILGEIFSRFQRIAHTVSLGDTERTLRCRDLSQGIAQSLLNLGERLTVFISHTKRNSPGEEENVEALIATVRDVIRNTRLQEFFDASDLQPGQDWDAELRNKAATSALLAIRTDLYPSREWCQREILIAKREGMPVVIMDALSDAEERGSFLMDHVPRVATRMAEGGWRRADICRGLNLLVDEFLKRAVWRCHSELVHKELGVNIAWWAPHAPEPITLTKWLENERRAGRLLVNGEDMIILHPDPPLGPEEKSVLQEILSLAGINRTIDVLTPRLLAARKV